RGWAPADSPAEPPSLSRGWAERPSSAPPAGPAVDPPEEPRTPAADDRRAPADERRPSPAEEPEWSEPGWGGGWAPAWSREAEPAGRRAREDETTGRRAHEEEPVGRRARDERAAEWAPEPAEQPTPYEPPRGEPTRPHEPVRAEPSSGYGPPRPEPTRPYEVSRSDAETRPAYEPVARESRERTSWAGPSVPVTPFSAPPHAAPTSAPPVPRAAPTSAPPVPREAPASAPPAGYGPPAGARAEEREGVSYRPRTDETPGPVASGGSRVDRVPAPASTPPYAARRSAPEPVPTAEPAAETRPADPTAAMLPQRVPAEPDVPVVPEPPAVEPSAETPELARIATHLRRDDEPAPLRERPEGFDVNAILDAVREVAGVRDAALRRTPAGAHSLRLDLADGADPAEVSRMVARLLQERMGLAAAPQNLPGAPAAAPPPVRRRSAQTRPERATGEPRVAEDRPGTPRPVPSRSEGRFGAPEARAGRPAELPAERAEPAAEPPRRRRQAATHRGRAAVEESSLAAAPAGAATGSPVTLGTSYSGGQMTTTETAPSRPLDTSGAPGPRVLIDHVQMSTFGLDATVEVRLIAGDRTAEGHATGPAVDGYLLRLCAVAAAAALDELLGRAASTGERGRCFVEHAAVVPFGNCEVATVVVLLVCDGWVEQLAGSALVAGDPRQAAVRATLAAVNRRLEALLA
ncbi:hypothetical protein A6A27_31020, partial [Micromonospora sp. CB01531]